MKLMTARTPQEGMEHHERNPLRIYSEDQTQTVRISRAKGLVDELLTRMPGRRKIVELGCGAGCISGPYSENHEVIGVECNTGCVAHARVRYPNMVVSQRPLTDVEPLPCDILVLCEILEHLTHPQNLLDAWLPYARALVVSHPLDEPIGSGLSGGDHCWSFDRADFDGWFKAGNYRPVSTEVFEMGSYRIILGCGIRD